MEIQTPICPICGKLLEKITTGNNIYRCQTLPDHVRYGSEAVFAFGDNGKLALWVLEMPPYVFTIYENLKRTTVHQNIFDETDGPLLVSKKLILDVDAILNLPWHDKSQVVDRVKTLLLFS